MLLSRSLLLKFTLNLFPYHRHLLKILNKNKTPCKYKDLSSNLSPTKQANKPLRYLGKQGIYPIKRYFENN
jgi:hypothetical protein